MYYLFCKKNVMPMNFYQMGPGEKRVIHGFIMKEINDTERAEGD